MANPDLQLHHMWDPSHDRLTLAGMTADLKAEVRWTRGSETELMSALEVRALDLVIGGLEQTSPWTKEASLIRPYFQTRRLVGVPGGSPLPKDIAGLEVVVEEAPPRSGCSPRPTAFPWLSRTPPACRTGRWSSTTSS